MRAHLIADGIVINTIILDSLDQAPGAIDADLHGGGIGWLWDGTTLTDPTPPPSVSAQRAAIWEQIKAIRDHKTQTGGYEAAAKWFHSDTFSRTQQLGLVMMGAGIPPGLQWKTMDGSFVTMTQTLAGQVFGAAAAQDQALFAHAETLRALVDSSDNPGSIDITAGWPATFA